MELVTFYDSSGAFAGVRRAGSGKPIEVDGIELVVDRIIGATGLEIKVCGGGRWAGVGQQQACMERCAAVPPHPSSGANNLLYNAPTSQTTFHHHHHHHCHQHQIQPRRPTQVCRGCTPASAASW